MLLGKECRSYITLSVNNSTQVYINKRMSNEHKEILQFEGLIDGLINNKFGCCNDFLSPTILAGLKVNMNVLEQSGELKVGGIGNKEGFQTNKSIRGDKINWIDEPSINLFETAYLDKIWRFIAYLNKTCFTSIKSFESHYANYEKGSFYKRHIDQFKTEKGRQYSIVLYLNENWKETDGGLLSLYPKNQKQTNISPIGGRLVFFKSDEMEHEVHSSLTRNRTSIAGWLKN